MFRRIQSEFQCLEGKDKIFDDYKYRAGIPMFRKGKIRKAMFQLKDKIKIKMLDKSKTTGVPMFERVYEFQCLEG